MERCEKQRFADAPLAVRLGYARRPKIVPSRAFVSGEPYDLFLLLGFIYGYEDGDRLLGKTHADLVGPADAEVVLDESAHRGDLKGISPTDDDTLLSQIGDQRLRRRQIQQRNKHVWHRVLLAKRVHQG